MSNDSTLSFDRMRGMLMRAAEIRDSEQQQIFDSLDEIHARLAALDALGTIRKRLTELPDRAEVSVLAERLDETLLKIDAQDAVLASLARAVEALPDRMARPIEKLDGRLDGMAGRMEGVAGRMDGLDDRLGGLHKRLDDLDNRLDRHEMRLDAMPSSVGGPVKERLEGVERAMREQIDNTARATDEGLRKLLGETGAGLDQRLSELAARPAVDPTEPLDGLGRRMEALAGGWRRCPSGWTSWRTASGPARHARRVDRGAVRPAGFGARAAAGRRGPERAGGQSQRGVGAAQRGPAGRGHGHVRRADPRPWSRGVLAAAPAPAGPAPHPQQGRGQVRERRRPIGPGHRRPGRALTSLDRRRPRALSNVVTGSARGRPG